MLTMSQINHIKDLSNCGYRIGEISEKTGTDPKTIRKYLAQEDFSPTPPIKQELPSKLEPFKSIIEDWLEEDILCNHLAEVLVSFSFIWNIIYKS